MTYYVAPIYSGSGDRPFEDTLSAVQQELFPKLKEGGGLLRYTTLILDQGGSIASTSLYETKEAARNGVHVAQALVSNAQWLQGYKLSQVLEGEVARTIQHNDINATYGVARIFQTPASAAQIAEAMGNPPDIFAIPGRARTFVVQLTDGRVAGFSSFDTKDTADHVAAAIKRVRGNPENPMAKLTPGAIEIISGRIVNSTAS